MPAGWVSDLVAEAEARLPEPVRRYYACGARDGISAAEAVGAWEEVRFLPRVLRDVRAVDASTTLFGTTYAQPFGIAPTSLQRCADPDGELAMAAAAATVGVPHVVSSNAGHRFADIGAAGGPWWLQTYVPEVRDHCLPLLEAACAAGAEAVVLTVDTPVPGIKYGVGDDDFAGVDLSWHRANYTAGVATGQRGQWCADLGYDDLAWLGERTGLPVVVKGVLHPDDARRCLDAGAAAVWVSNHGGRQLDRAATTAAVLPHVREAVGADALVLVDGGIRTGLDVLAALSRGADAVFLGRLPLWALAAGGRDRVVATLGRVASELAEGMRLGGVVRPEQAPDLRFLC